MTDSPVPTPCPNCGEPATGRFCSSCGSPLGAIACGACGAELARGAKFCHSCGTPVALPGAAQPAAPAPPAAKTSGSSDAILWSVIAIALLALIAMVAGQRFARSGQSAGAATVSSTDAENAPAPMGTAPDISQMTPDQQAQRLYALITGFYTAGHTDSVQMFAPMATGAYQMLPSMSLGERYEYGRIELMTGNPEGAAAEADTILKAHPNHLLGLVLAAQAAKASNDSAAERRYLDRLAKAAPAEEAKKLPEYQDHADDIQAALAQARKG
jgi:Double zinc ribbon